MKRRDFLRVFGALSGSAVLASCGSRERSRKLVSYVLPPEEGILPGEASFHPSTCTECPAGCGLLVKVRDGWPIKLEGVPGHPVSDGGLCIRGQASLTRLYHPERVRNPVAKTGNGKYRDLSWDDALTVVAKSLQTSRKEGRRSVYLPGRTTGFLSRAIDRFCDAVPVERLPGYEVYGHSAVKEACALLFGERDVPLYRIDEADLLVTVGADILESYISPVSYTRMVSRARSRGDFRWWHLEPHFSLTGANADRRIAVRPGREADLLAYLLGEVSGRGVRKNRLPGDVADRLPLLSTETASERTGVSVPDLREMAALLANARRPLLFAGGLSTAHPTGLETAFLAGLLQWATDAVPGRVDFSRSENYGTVGSAREIEELAERMGREEIGVLFLSRVNPLFTLPEASSFRENLKKVRLTVGIGDLPDETLRAVDVVLPLSHSLESWGDLEPRRGIVGALRPVREPLFDTRSEGEILEALREQVAGGKEAKRGEDPSAGWLERFGAAGRDTLLAQGVLERTGPSKRVSLDGRKAAAFLRGMRPGAGEAGPFLVLAPSLRTFDGRSRSLRHLAEIPDPLTTISYGSWVSVSPADAGKSGLADRDEIRISAAGWSATLPVKVQPGLPEGVFAAYRDFLEAPPVRTETRTGETVEYVAGIAFTRTGKRASIPILSGSPSQQGRGLIPDPVHREKEHGHEQKSLYPEHEHKEHRWAMAVDLDLCTGCSACVAACYVENNIPVVGKTDHLRGREMSWLRIEPFYGQEGGVEFLPMLCQQCHYAPCEPVCPVFAAYHNPEGLNVQVYSRCVGTRYCSNNCPYKVRRFNWWPHRWPAPSDRMLNPDVLARNVGVMEKCTFCIQRIRAAKDRAKDESRGIRDGEFTTACAQSCPTGALVFGDLLDPGSRVSRLARSEKAYRVFELLGTEPSVYYLRGKPAGHGT